MRTRKFAKKKRIRNVFLAICEGETEAEYINGLKRILRVPIEIRTKVCGNKITQRLISQYRTELALGKDDFCQVFLVYDADVAPIVNKISRLDGILILSNPCVELWFLLHTIEYHQSKESDGIIRQLISSYPAWNNYQKGRFTQEQWKILKENMDTAIKNAKKLVYPENPSSNMYVLIESIKEGENG